MNNEDFFTATTLQYRIKNLTQRLREFETGDRYIKIQQEFQNVFRHQNADIKKLKDELAKAHAETVTVRKYWTEVIDDMDGEYQKELTALKKENKKLAERNLELERQRDEALDKLRDTRKELCETQSALYDRGEEIKGLTARINKDFTNSSKPSSQSPNHKKTVNNREKSGKKRGGQKGHVHHPRKRAESTRIIEIPPPAEYTCSPDFKETGRIISKQLIKLRVGIDVTEYTTPEYRNRTTGQRVHAGFPEGLRDDVTYDGSVKALAYLLNNECYVSIEKTKKFINEISGGKLDLSTGLICSLSRQFSEKTREEREEIFLRLLSSPAMHADFTFGRMDGKQTSVIICASGNDVLYQGRKKKGDEGVKGSPLEHYNGILVSDHEAALIKHGSQNQECMTHVRRHVVSSIENEKDLTWNKRLKKWIDEAVAYWNEIQGGEAEKPERAEELIQEYDGIMYRAKEEYEYVPPSEYFMDGYNLYKRMSEDKDRYILFLRNPSVEPDNNLAERYARKFKRKNAQVMCFRSQEGVERFCDGLSIIQSIKTKGENLYETVSEIFNKT